MSDSNDEIISSKGKVKLESRSRADDTRMTDSRINDTRAADSRSGTFVGHLESYDKSKVPPGMKYEWKRFLKNGEPDRVHLGQMKREGFEFVPSSRHPEMSADSSIFPSPRPTIIEHGDLVLMERSEFLYNQYMFEKTNESKQELNRHKRQFGSSLGQNAVPNDPQKGFGWSER